MTHRSRCRGLAAMLLSLAVLGVGCGQRSGSEDAAVAVFEASGSPTWVGRPVCARCHVAETDLWRGSHHDLAMQTANEQAVLGDFNDVTVNDHGATFHFTHRDGRFFVRTAGPDGEPGESSEPGEYEIGYTFGAHPLQQYLIGFPDGRYQVLGLAWDSRTADEGGQRWFSIYPDETLDPGDRLHWTGQDQTWNFMCADCHSTNLVGGYDLDTDTYRTTWSEIDVSCEACHGPGSTHASWARARADGADVSGVPDLGLTVRLQDRDGGEWRFVGDEPTAKRSVPRESRTLLETCAPCHSRRLVIDDDTAPARELMDRYRPRLLEEQLYHADGQILEEVFVYGSFVQSKMHAQGVTCTDCHEPHGLELRAGGNGVCATCHLSRVFDTAEHHFHEPDKPGARCVDCHMPSRNFMVVDPRRDHSIRVPRPDLSTSLGTPNACNDCHADRSPGWAAEQVARWYGPDRRQETHYGEAIAAGRRGDPGAAEALRRLADDASQSGMARASALQLLASSPGPASVPPLERALEAPDPLVREAALRTLEPFAPADRLRLAGPRTKDPVRAVRIAAARVLAAVDRSSLPPGEQTAFERSLRELITSERINGDRPESHLNLGILFSELNRFDEAEQAYLTALRLDPTFVAGQVNLADLYRQLGRDAEGEPLLREALRLDPEDAPAHHSLGLLLVRRKQYAEAREPLERAARLQPDNPRFALVYAVALDSLGDRGQALWELEQAHQRVPNDRQLLEALVAYCREEQDLDLAALYARKLLALAPDNQLYHQLLKQLEPS